MGRLGGGVGGGGVPVSTDSLRWPENVLPIGVGLFPEHHPWIQRGLPTSRRGASTIITLIPLPRCANQQPGKRDHHPPSEKF